MPRWFKTKPWRLLEIGEPVDGDCSIELVESNEGLSIAVTEFLGAGTTRTRTEALLVEADWDQLIEAVARWRAQQLGEPTAPDQNAGELVRLLVGLELSHAAGFAQRVGDRAASRLSNLARRVVDGPGAQR